MTRQSHERCRWFLRCANHAVGTITHPILGEVPCCARCQPRAGRPFTIPAPDVDDGWALFNNDSEIQRDDELAIFDTDQQAWAYVIRRAREGSDTHLGALITLRGGSTPNYWARVGAEDMGPHQRTPDDGLVNVLLGLPGEGEPGDPECPTCGNPVDADGWWNHADCQPEKPECPTCHGPMEQDGDGCWCYKCDDAGATP